MKTALLTFAKAAVIAGLLGLSACATQFRSEVQSFHKFAAAPGGETFRVIPADPAKQGSLEFEAYAGLVRGEMVRLGYKPVNASNAADIDVKLGYSISEPVEKVETRPGFGGYASLGYNPFFYGNRGYYRRGYHPGFAYSSFGYDPFWGNGLWDAPEVYSYSVYTRKMNVTMTRAATSEQLYDGKVESAGKDNRLPELMPYLVQSMFQDFPGQSGATRKVVIELPQK
jgi:Domain of unknown function (DUF4136)